MSTGVGVPVMMAAASAARAGADSIPATRLVTEVGVQTWRMAADD
jgi:hypothetical protein